MGTIADFLLLFALIFYLTVGIGLALQFSDHMTELEGDPSFWDSLFFGATWPLVFLVVTIDRWWNGE